MITTTGCSLPALIGLPVPSVTALSLSLCPAQAITLNYMFSYGKWTTEGRVASDWGVREALCEKVILELHSSVPVMLCTDAN